MSATMMGTSLGACSPEPVASATEITNPRSLKLEPQELEKIEPATVKAEPSKNDLTRIKFG